LLNQSLGRNVGYINPALYQGIGPAGVLRAVSEGNNGLNGVKGDEAGAGWNPVAGWGSPYGKKLLKCFEGRPPANPEAPGQETRPPLGKLVTTP
jgi:kumamolisin